MSSEILIRKATNNDLPTIKELILQSFEVLIESQGEIIRQRILQYIHQDIYMNELHEQYFESIYYSKFGNYFWVAENVTLGEVVGCIGIKRTNSDQSELVRMSVSNNQRRKNIGGLLMESLIRFAYDSNCLSIFLTTGNPIAIKFYEKNGFIRANHSPPFKMVRLLGYRFIKRVALFIEDENQNSNDVVTEPMENKFDLLNYIPSNPSTVFTRLTPSSLDSLQTSPSSDSFDFIFHISPSPFPGTLLSIEGREHEPLPLHLAKLLQASPPSEPSSSSTILNSQFSITTSLSSFNPQPPSSPAGPLLPSLSSPRLSSLFSLSPSSLSLRFGPLPNTSSSPTSPTSLPTRVVELVQQVWDEIDRHNSHLSSLISSSSSSSPLYYHSTCGDREALMLSNLTPVLDPSSPTSLPLWVSLLHPSFSPPFPSIELFHPVTLISFPMKDLGQENTEVEAVVQCSSDFIGREGAEVKDGDTLFQILTPLGGSGPQPLSFHLPHFPPSFPPRPASSYHAFFIRDSPRPRERVEGERVSEGDENQTAFALFSKINIPIF